MTRHPKDRAGRASSFDIIGDVHGHADALVALLERLGYRKSSGAWGHPQRIAVFVGDYIDRGPKQLETIRIVRGMVDVGAAHAIMGNHEFNAIAWFTPDPDQPGEYLRPRAGEVGRKNRKQHERFLAEVGEDSAMHRECIEWFRTLPLWLDLAGIRVVHATWHDGFMKALASDLRPGGIMGEGLVVAASRKGSAQFRAVEALLKGLEVPLPEGLSFRDKDGHERRSIRTRWWCSPVCTYREGALFNDGGESTLSDAPMPENATIGYTHSEPVFFGHYWLTGTPRLFSSVVACVDYSVARGGKLCAYRWDGERELDARRFMTVP